MVNPYFLTLGQDSVPEEGVDAALEPFRRYLQNAIDALRKKEVSCTWEALENSVWQAAFPWNIFEITPQTDIEICSPEDGWFRIIKDCDEDEPPGRDFEPDFEEKVFIGKGKNKEAHFLTNEDLSYIEGEWRVRLTGVKDAKRISWSGYSLEVEALGLSLGNSISFAVNGRTIPAEFIDSNRYRLFCHVGSSSEITANGLCVDFQVTMAFKPESMKGRFVRKVSDCFWLLSKESPSIPQTEIRNISKKFRNELYAGSLMTDNGPLLESDWRLEVSTDALTLHPARKGVKALEKIWLSGFPGVELEFVEEKAEEKWIQLIDDAEGDDVPGQSKLDLFFEYGAEIQDGSARGNVSLYSVLNKREEERQLLLGIPQKGKKHGAKVSCLPQGKWLKTRVDIGQLIQQQNAIRSLKQTPAKELAPLLRLFQGRKVTHWPSFGMDDPESICWDVLSDPEFDGCDRQREFVAKALVTPDFAILDGPPGTGKTTCILELILQLVRQGKRILLSASTHAAINNVLERIKEKELGLEIYPLRIGDKNRANGVEEFQYESVLEELYKSAPGITEQILVDSSNLVCGTTMGINRLFRNRGIQLNKGFPPFDVLIIDECSKTTFQEFLVPAQYAKRWVLVGDVRQLSPFTDREQITANLDNLVLTPGKKGKPAITLEPSIQKACFYLHQLAPYMDKRNKDKLIVPVSQKELKDLDGEVVARKLQDKIGFLGSSKIIYTSNWANPAEIYRNPLWPFSFNLIFVEEAILDSIQDRLPCDAIILGSDWLSSQHRFRHAASWEETHHFRNGKKEIRNALELHTHLQTEFQKRSWSGELCWRLEREYWLRLGKNSNGTSSYEKQIDKLLPKSVKADGRVYMLRNMAFPSILESLSGSGMVKKKAENETTLNQGFHSEEKRARHTTLTYQHRMHPDISSFPRDAFYNDGIGSQSLLDGRFVQSGKREWGYDRYASRCHWIDVTGTVFKNRNEKEVDAILQELESFCSWAKGKKNQDGNDFDVGILTFYKGQEAALRKALQKKTRLPNAYSRFSLEGINIRLATVDFFQGQEADLVFLSMVNTNRDGFLDSPNRLNVAITRARYQLVIVGCRGYFSEKSRTSELKGLAIAAG